MNKAIFRQEAINFQRERLEGEVFITQPLSFVLVTLISALIFCGVCVFLVLGSFTSKERVKGYLVPKEGLVNIYPDKIGVISKLFVESGDKVSKGQPLVEIRTDETLNGQSSTSYLIIEELKKQKNILQSKLRRLKAENKKRRVYLAKRIEGSKSKIDQMDKQIAVQEEQLNVSKKIYESLDGLRKKKLVAEEQYQLRYQSYLNERQKIEQLKQTYIENTDSLTVAEFELNTLDDKLKADIDDINTQISSINERILQNQGQLSYTLTSTIEGVITAVQLSQGQRVLPERPILAILPEGSELEADIFIPTRSIGFVENGQKIRIRYNSFPYQRFGSHEGEILRTAKTALTPSQIESTIPLQEAVYRARARLSSQQITAYGKRYPLQSGMQFEADIFLDERPLYQWLFKAFYGL